MIRSSMRGRWPRFGWLSTRFGRIGAIVSQIASTTSRSNARIIEFSTGWAGLLYACDQNTGQPPTGGPPELDLTHPRFSIRATSLADELVPPIPEQLLGALIRPPDLSIRCHDDHGIWERIQGRCRQPGTIGNPTDRTTLPAVRSGPLLSVGDIGSIEELESVGLSSDPNPVPSGTGVEHGLHDDKAIGPVPIEAASDLYERSWLHHRRVPQSGAVVSNTSAATNIRAMSAAETFSNTGRAGCGLRRLVSQGYVSQTQLPS